MKTEKLQLALVKGMPYLIKIRNGIRVLRVYKYEEIRILGIKCFVFTSKVKRGVYAEVAETETETTYTWKNTSTAPAQELSIPHYDIISITPAPIHKP